MIYTPEQLRTLIQEDIKSNEPALQKEQRIHTVTYQITKIEPVQTSPTVYTIAYHYKLIFRYPYEEEQIENHSRILKIPHSNNKD